MKNENGRRAALTALERIRRAGRFSGDAVETAAAGLDAREASLAAKLVYGVLQNMALLDYYIGCYSSVKTSRMEPTVLDILRISAFQIVFMDRVPNSAAVNEAVTLCSERGNKRASGLVNAVLRRISEKAGSLPAVPGEGTADFLAVRYSHPLWLAEELISEYGYEFTRGFFEANNDEPPICAQVNTLRTDTAALSCSLRDSGVETRPRKLPDSLRLRVSGSVAALPQFEGGMFYVQDDAARLAVAVSGAAAGMSVLDACAAPGGKSFAAAVQMRGEGRILACDIQEKKLRRIEEGARRLGVGIIETRQMDAAAPKKELFGAFNVVIADAPCSGLGVIRKKPDVRYKRPEELSRLPDIQSAILGGLAQCVKPGGTLLYSTCTVRRAENEEVAERFLAAHRDFSAGEMRTLWPHIDDTDGFFICRMTRSI